MSELTKALIGFHKAVDKIDKNARGNFGKFADLSNVLSTVTPALSANGLAITQTFDGTDLVTTLRHVSGETVTSDACLVVADGRNVTQEWGKAVTYQRRYSICSILGLVADMDTDAESTPEPPKAASKPAPKATPEPPKAAPVQPKEEEPLSSDERSMVLQLIKQHVESYSPADSRGFIETLATGFFARFPEARASGKLSNAIQTQSHAEFINTFLNS